VREIIILLICYGFPIMTTLYVSIEIFSRNPWKREHQLAGLTTLCLALIFIEELVRYFLPISHSPQLVALWLGNVAALLPSLSLHFIFRLTGISHRMPRWLYPYFLYMPLIAIALTFLKGNVYNSTEFIQDGMWKVQIPALQYYIAMTIGNILIITYFLLLRHGMRKAASKDRRDMMRILFYGGVFNLIWNIVFGYINFGGMLPPYPYLWGSFAWCIFLRYTMLKYDFLSSPIKRFETLYMMNPAAILLLDQHGIIREANPSAQKLLKVDHPVQRPLYDFSVQQREVFRAQYKEYFQNSVKLMQHELTVVNEEGEEKIVLLDSDYVFIEDDLLCMVIMRDVTELKQAEEQVRFLAYHDTLTGLPNRYFFYERLEQVIAGAKPDSKGAVILLDLDGFKQVNDTYGHHVGDAFLSHVAALLRKCITARSFAARLAGDEFVVVVEGADEEYIEQYVQSLQTLIRQTPFLWQQTTIPVRASIGVGVFQGKAQDAESIVQSADAAMYSVKNQGKNGYFVSAVMYE